MDSFLIDYLKSGNAWVLIGSGPSIEMGYPSWEKLASFAIEAVKTEGRWTNSNTLESAMKCQDFPMVFEEVKTILGGPRLLQYLQDRFKPSRSGRIYELIARWPVQVYLTTNYDDEIQKHLVNLGEAYQTYFNSEDHFSYLLPELNGAIFKLHGDLRSESGLILTTNQYREIEQGESWRYWRTKMTSVFQMNRMVVIGHSLSDNNIKHVLEAAKQGAGVLQPICWIAPDVKPKQAKEFLEKYRIRVIPYDNRDGEHRNLFPLIEHISNFLHSRTTVQIQQHIAKASQSPLGINAAAPGFFVFNKLALQSDFDEKRIDIVIAAIQATIPKLISYGEFTLETVLEIIGWPKDLSLESEFANQIRLRAIQQELLIPVGEKFKVGNQAEALALQNKNLFEHMRERFKNRLVLRIKRGYPSLSDSDASLIASDIESALVGYFREGGLSLATTLFSTKQPSNHVAVPSSIVKFITESSARYNDLLKRQAFCTISVDSFVHAGSAEREYLGRISQGFFAFHSLGVFGDAAIERLKHAKETVWLVDSSAQIPALALAAPTNAVFRNCFTRLRSIGVRLFTTEKLFDETYEHFRFANNVIMQHGVTSLDIIDAAEGNGSYRKSNQFLEGFILWQAASNPCDWESYLFQAFGQRNPHKEDLKKTLHSLGVEVIDFRDWLGFVASDWQESNEYTQKIVGLIEDKQQTLTTNDMELWSDLHRKAAPEAEAFIIVKREREGKYYIMSECGYKSPSWFISHTSILNFIENGSRITWQPEAFLRFASTLSPTSDSQSANQAFETILWGLAQSGLSVIDENIVTSLLGDVIEQAEIDTDEMRQLYENTIAQKYGESRESIMKRVSAIQRPLVAIQLANEMAQAEAQKRVQVEMARADEAKRAKRTEKELQELDRFRKKMNAKKERGKRKSRKQQSLSKKKKRK